MSFGSLPKLFSKEFSGLLSEKIVASENEKVKEFLIKVIKVCFYPEEFPTFQANLSLMSPIVRLASMKSLVALFDVGEYHHEFACRAIHTATHEFACRAIHTVTKIMAEMAKLPSEVKDGIILIKTSVSILSTFTQTDEEQSTSSKPNVGDVLTEMAVALTGLLKKMEVFEMSVARLGQEKTEAVKFLVEMVLLYKIDAERSEKIKECMKTIFEGETRLQGVLESANGIQKEIVPLLSKIEEDYRRLVEVETLVVQGSKTFTYSKWSDSAELLYSSDKDIHQEGDGICFIELLSHYLNAKTIIGPTAGEELNACLYGKSKTGADYVMLNITLDRQEAHSVVKGVVSIRSNSENLCDHARSKVDSLMKNPALMNF